MKSKRIIIPSIFALLMIALFFIFGASPVKKSAQYISSEKLKIK